MTDQYDYVALLKCKRCGKTEMVPMQGDPAQPGVEIDNKPTSRPGWDQLHRAYAHQCNGLGESRTLPWGTVEVVGLDKYNLTNAAATRQSNLVRIAVGAW